MKSFGNLIYQLRIDRGFNRFQVEKLTGVSHDYIKRIELGKYIPNRLTLFSVVALCDFYSIPLTEAISMLFEEANEQEV